ncbi:cytochrome P450 9e2 [Cherax quadricarinatus]|uniref:cytochrome P450 9e2 n=1 Tax=Cherax quadricarinatus TaxID=27406 RepID=UPI00387E32C5
MDTVVWLFVVGLVLAAWSYSRWRHNHWSTLGVPTPPYLPFLGHIHKQLSLFQTRWEYLDEVYYKYGGSTFCGMYEIFRPVLMIGDPDLLKNILVKDFDHFIDRRKFPATEGSLTNQMLANKSGDEWRALRAVVTPTFTSGKMRGMFPLISDKADDLVSFTLKEAAKKPYVDMKVNSGRFTMDTIASCAFGIECNSFRNEETEFTKWAQTLFAPSLITTLKFTLIHISPRIFNALRLTLETSAKTFFQNVVEQTIAVRKNGQRRGDYLDLLLDARANHDQHTTKSTSIKSNTTRETSTTDNLSGIDSLCVIPSKQVLTDESIVAQSVLFLLAAFDTTASTIAFASFLLAKYPVHQQRLRQELQQMVQEHGDVTYQGIMEATFLDACIMESLRLYPPAVFGSRVCNKTYKIPGTKVVLRPGDLVTIPFWSLHHDPRYWPEPEVFLPDRFLPENKTNITSFTHMPFGMGPRNCIGMRFALMKVKVALAKLLLKAEIHLRSGHEEPKLERSPFLLRPGGLHLVVSPLTAKTNKQ